MVDNFPLIPNKGAVCADVRPVLREVFREQDYLPPLSLEKTTKPPGEDEDVLVKQGEWIDNYSKECKDIYNREYKLKQDQAKRISKEPLPNIYKLSSPRSESDVSSWRKDHGIISRKHLMPTVDQNAGREASLWVQNILNRSSCDVSCIEVRGSRLHLPLHFLPPDEGTVQSLSIGSVEFRPPPPPPPVPQPPPPPENIICVPPKLEFVNFTVGHLHTQSIRLINVSKLEIRLSVRPPSRRELDVLLCGARGLAVSSGASAELRVRFTPRDVRAVRDALFVRVSAGRDVSVPILCYMQPPIVDVLVPHLSWTSVCTSSSANVRVGRDVLELGARLLGDVHCAKLLLHCNALHAAFFVLTEDAWITFCIDTLTRDGAVVAGPFTISPAWWRGGGAVRGSAWCRAPHAGLHVAALRILASTAVARPLNILADSLLFSPKHITLEAQEKDYDICSEDDPACEYYVHLGTAFPNRALSATVQLVNHSPVTYSYYWSVRPWGVCSCWEEEQCAGSAAGEHSEGDERLCVGALEARAHQENNPSSENGAASTERLLRVEPAHGKVAPRSAVALQVCAPDVASELGTQRASLMLILKDIPKESFPPDYNPMIVKTETMMAESIPGHEPWSREICEVVCAQMEVWWEVVPVRFVVDPPILPLPHSRRVKQVEVMVRATQLYGNEDVYTQWSLPPLMTQAAVNSPTAPSQPSRVPSTHSYAPSIQSRNARLSRQSNNGRADSTQSHNARDTTPSHTARGSSTQSHASRAPSRASNVGILRQSAAPVPPPQLSHTQSATARLVVPLPSLPNEQPKTDVIVLEALSGEWEAKSKLIRQCATRHPRLEPARDWLGVVTPGAHMRTYLEVLNDTHQHICWWGTPYRWHGENKPSALCEGREPCPQCRERACTCALLQPTRGALQHGQRQVMMYDVNAPDKDGCVATLLQVRRTLGDVARVAGGAGCEARASLVAYRVLAPRLVLRALPCHGERRPEECEGCNIDQHKGSGTAVLRPSKALALGRCTCYRLRITNITPLPTTVKWEAPLEKEEAIRLAFIPNDFDIGSYGQLEIRVVVEARKVCGRRLFVYRARVAHAHKPMYLLIDTAVAGFEILCEIPIGGEEKTFSKVIMRRTQRAESPGEERSDRPLTAEEMFEAEDRKKVAQAESTCHCKYKMVYIPKVKPPKPPPATEDDLSSVEIVTEPPPLTRLCACDECAKPILPDFEEPYCLQFKGIPLRTVRTRTLIIRNTSVLTARWTSAVRHWPRKRCRTLATDPWANGVGFPGVALQLSPAAGVIGAGAVLELAVSVYADCWGLYKDQILIKIDKLEPIILDVWVEAYGPPLELMRAPRCAGADCAPTLWMSSSDPDRVIRVKNVSHSQLVVQAYVLTVHEHLQDEMPFRMYLRFFDVLPCICSCVTAFDSNHCLEEQSSASSSMLPEDMDTGVEIFFTKDYGVQDDTYYKVEPSVFTIDVGALAELKVTLAAPEHGELAPKAVILLRSLPNNFAGPGWYRDEQPPQLVHLRQTEREGVLRASDRQLRVKFCALNLPCGDVMRIRKTFRVQNIGNGPLHVTAGTKGLWTLLQGSEHGGGDACEMVCGCEQIDGERVEKMPLYVPARSSKEMTVEVCICTEEAWPTAAPAPCSPHSYDEWRRSVTPLDFYDDDNVLLTIPLVLELEYPILRLEPACIDFGFVTDGDARKSYFTVAHSSRTMALDLVTEWVGKDDFKLWPRRLHLPPGASERVYVQYVAKWHGSPLEGCALVSYAASGAGAWCRASVQCRATPARDHKCHLSVHDHTDDTVLLPPSMQRLRIE